MGTLFRGQNIYLTNIGRVLGSRQGNKHTSLLVLIRQIVTICVLFAQGRYDRCNISAEKEDCETLER
jgi:hypothetical protein